MEENKKTILVVDDTPANIDILVQVLHERYKTKVATNGEKALQIARKFPQPDMILLDIMMPEMDGYKVCERLKSDPLTAKIPVIFITAMNHDEDEAKGLELGAVDYITKPIRPSITLSRIKTQLALYDQNRELEEKVTVRTAELNESRLQVIRRLGRAAEYKDNETGLHVIRMSHYSRLIAESYIGGTSEWTELVFQASPMHDIGKIGIPDRILLKPEKLDDEEWAMMLKHPEFGAEIIGEHPSGLLQMAHEIALNHHEKYDGSGYPRGLKGEEIPLSARIVAIADVFDALTTLRPYKHAWSVEQAVDYILTSGGSHFDPELIGHFQAVLPQILSIRKEFAERETAAS